MATFRQPNFSDIVQRMRGVTAEAYFQLRYYIGLAVRAVALQQVGYYHQFSGLDGLRFAMHLWHTNPYTELDAGLSPELATT
jgi:hypothetical protein